MKEKIGKALSWLKSVASEHNGTGSASRVIALVVAGGCVLYVILHLLILRKPPEHDQWTGIGTVLGAGQASYLANQGKAAATGDAQNITPTTPQNPAEGEGD